MQLAHRRIVARVVRFGLVAFAIVLVAAWLLRRTVPDRPFRVEMDAAALPVMGPGDVQLFNEDSTVDVILAGDQITAGLSPRMVAKIRGELTRSASAETSGLGGSIARMVKETVADKIGTRAVYSLSDIEDIRYDDGRVIVDWTSGREGELLGNVRVDGDRVSNRFPEEDGRRFVEAVRARMRARR